MTHVQQRLRVAERRACRVLGQSRATQRRVLRVAEDEPRLVARIVELTLSNRVLKKSLTGHGEEDAT